MKVDKNTLIFLFTFVLKIVIQFLNLYLIAQYINKIDYSEYNYALLFVNVFLVFSIGIVDGLNIEIPYYKLKNEDLLKESINTSYSYFFVLFLITIASYIIGYKYIDVSTAGSLFILIMCLFTLFEYFLLSVLRGLDKVTIINKANLIFSIVQIITIYLIIKYNLDGLYYKMMISQVIYVGFMYYYFENKFNFKFDFKVLKNIIKVGFPIYAFHYINTLGISLDKILLVKFYDKNLLGIYSYGSIMYMFYLLLSKVLIMYFYPKFIHYSVSLKSFELKNIYIKYLISSLITSSVLFVIIYFLSDYIFTLFLPRYIESLPVFKIFSGIGIFLLSNFSSYILITSFKNNKITITYNILTILPIYLTPLVLFLFFEFNLINLSISILVSNIIIFLICQIFVFYFFKNIHPNLSLKSSINN